MLGDTPLRVVYKKVVNGVERLFASTTASGNQGAHVLSLVGEGNQFWAWNTIPPGRVVACDFTDAPVCTGDATTNNELIYGITVDPADVLTYA